MAFDPREQISQPEANLPEPPSLVAGHYYGQITAVSPPAASRWDPNVEAVGYSVQLLEPGDDIDPKDIEGVDLPSVTLFPRNYSVTLGGLNAMKELHRSLKLPSTNSFEQNWVECVAKRVLVTIATKPSTRAGDPRTFSNITAIAGTDN